MSRTILITAGGTGGHVFPGLAVAEAMRAAGWRVVWLGAKNGLEARLVPARGYEMAWVRAGALRGKALLARLLLPFNLLIGFWQSARAILRHRPDVVLGMGGYVAFPGGMMASLLNRPLVIHEQNAIAGFTNRTLAKISTRVLEAFAGSFAAGVTATEVGNPVRDDFFALAPPATRYGARSGPLQLLVVGGSQGAQRLNNVVPEAIAKLAAGTVHVRHQSGIRMFEGTQQAYQSRGIAAEVSAFIDDIAMAYGAADLVICRAGALTVSEIAAAGVASLLVPFPAAVDDHQTRNAQFLVAQGAAILIPERDLTAEKLATELKRFATDRSALLSMAERARRIARPESTADLGAACLAAGGLTIEVAA